MSEKAELIPGSGNISSEENTLYSDIRTMIAEARKRAAVAINAEAVMVYWQVGTRISPDERIWSRMECTDSPTLSPQCGEFFAGADCLRTAETIELDTPENDYVRRF